MQAGHALQTAVKISAERDLLATTASLQKQITALRIQLSRLQGDFLLIRANSSSSLMLLLEQGNQMPQWERVPQQSRKACSLCQSLGLASDWTAVPPPIPLRTRLSNGTSLRAHHGHQPYRQKRWLQAGSRGCSVRATSAGASRCF